jgi:CheY-like chemotaxis protein
VDLQFPARYYPDHEMSSAFAKTGTEPLAKNSSDADLPSILLVEDEKPLRDILVLCLLADGFDCREAADGQAAIDLLADGVRINLVLSNMLLPKVDGYTLMQHVKQRYPRIPFAFITAVQDAQVREQAMREGADGYLLKPFTRQELTAMVRSVLGRRR